MTTPDTAQIANRLVELLRQGLFLDAQHEVFASDAINVEPEQASARSVNGLDAILKKEQQFQDRIKEWKEIAITEPVVAGRYFSVQMSISVILNSGEPMHIDEIIVYEVHNGKIIKEQFFY